MMLSYFEDLVSGIEKRIAADPSGATARKAYALEIARLGARLFSDSGRVAWCGVLAPFDLLSAMGVTSCFVEFVGAMLASTGAVEPMLEKAEESGYAPDSCSYHRAVLGAAEQGLMPRPDFLIGTTAPCTGGLAVIENLARQFDRELFILQIPHGRGEDDVAWLAEQYEEMVAFVTRHTGRELVPSELEQAVVRTNEARGYLIEAYGAARSVPTPARRRDLVNLGIVMALLLGTEAGVRVAQTYREELTSKAAAGTAGVPGERIRLMWLQNRIQFRNPLDKLLEEEFGATVVVDELNDITWEPIDPADPYVGFARRTLSIPLTGSVQRRVDSIKRLAAEYKVDGAINPCHWGCRQGTGARGLVADGLKEAGVPVLNLEVDCIDPRQYAEGQLKTRIEAFMEMLEARKAV